MHMYVGSKFTIGSCSMFLRMGDPITFVIWTLLAATYYKGNYYSSLFHTSLHLRLIMKTVLLTHT